MRVAADTAADSTRRTCPGFQAGKAVTDQPAHEAVDRDGSVGADMGAVLPLDVSAARPYDDATDASIGHEHVGATAEHRNGHTVEVREAEDINGFRRRARLDEQI